MAGSLFSNAVITFFVNTKQAEGAITGFESKFSQSMKQMKAMIAGFIGFQGLRGAYTGMMQLVETADKLQLPVEDVSRFANLFSVFGGTADEATSALERFDDMARQLKFHSSGPLRELSAIISTNLNNKDYNGIIEALRRQWPRLSDDAQREVLDMLGTNSVAMRRILSVTNDELAKAKERSESLGIVTAENAKKFRDMRQALAETKNVLQQVAIPFLEALRPVLEIVRDLLIKFNELPDRVKKGLAWGTIALGAVSAIAKIIKAVKDLNDALKITTILSALASGGATLAFGAAALAAAGIAYAGYKASENENSPVKRTNPVLNIDPDSQPADIAQSFADWNKENENKFFNTSIMEHVFKNTGQPVPQKANETKVTNDNRSVAINIYGVDGAEDMMSRLRGLPMNNMSPISWK